MSILQVNEVDLSPKLQEVVKHLAAEEGKKQAEALVEKLKENLSLPRYMNYKQAAEYMNTSYNTLKYVCIQKQGLRVILIDGYEKIDRKDIDEFLEKHKK